MSQDHQYERLQNTLGFLSYVSKITLCDGQVRQEGLSQHGLSEKRSLGNVTHQELDDNKELVNRLLKAGGDAVLGCFSDGLCEKSVSGCIVQLKCLDPSKVISITCRLVITRLFGERALGKKLVGLIIEVVIKVVA